MPFWPSVRAVGCGGAWVMASASGRNSPRLVEQERQITPRCQPHDRKGGGLGANDVQGLMANRTG